MLNFPKRKIFYFKANYYKKYNVGEKMRILGRGFIKKNCHRCKIIYKNKLYELKEYFEDIQKNYNYNEIVKLKLIIINNIIDMSYMFYDCHYLISLSINKQKNLQIYITNMIAIFHRCYSLISLPDISE